MVQVTIVNHSRETWLKQVMLSLSHVLCVHPEMWSSPQIPYDLYERNTHEKHVKQLKDELYLNKTSFIRL